MDATIFGQALGFASALFGLAVISAEFATILNYLLLRPTVQNHNPQHPWMTQ